MWKAVCLLNKIFQIKSGMTNIHRSRVTNIPEVFETNVPKDFSRQTFQKSSAASAAAARPGPWPLAIPGVTPVPPETEICEAFSEQSHDNFSSGSWNSVSDLSKTNLLSLESLLLLLRLSLLWLLLLLRLLLRSRDLLRLLPRPLQKKPSFCLLFRTWSHYIVQSSRCSTWIHPCRAQAFQRR